MGGEQDNDIAVLKIDATGLQHVTLGNSSQLVVGESVYAIGNPLGELTYTLTDGIVSALDRLITTGSGNDSTTMNMLQTNCAINPATPAVPCSTATGRSSASPPPNTAPPAPAPMWRAWLAYPHPTM